MTSQLDGASAPQCVPQSGTCEMTTTTCSDDSWEVNDSFAQATSNPALAPGAYDLVSCPDPADDIVTNRDWFRIVVSGDAQIDLKLAGTAATDLDLFLIDGGGNVIKRSVSLSSTEEVATCLPAGTYYVKVVGFGGGRNAYKLTYTTTAQSCTAACTDDSREPDVTAATARAVTLRDYASSGNQICPNNDDWY